MTDRLDSELKERRRGDGERLADEILVWVTKNPIPECLSGAGSLQDAVAHFDARTAWTRRLVAEVVRKNG